MVVVVDDDHKLDVVDNNFLEMVEEEEVHIVVEHYQDKILLDCIKEVHNLVDHKHLMLEHAHHCVDNN